MGDERRLRSTLQRMAAPLAVLLLALGLRLTHLLYLRQSDPLFAFPVMDARWHVEWARAISLGIWEGEPFFRAPLYPFFLALLFKLFGSGYFMPRLVHALIGSLSCLLVWALGRRLGGRHVGLIAGLMAALYAPLIHFDSEFLIEPIFLPLIVASLLLLLRAAESSAAGRSARASWMVAGLVAGLATLARPNMLLVATGCVVWIVRQPARGAARTRAVMLWLSMFFVPVAGVTLFNAAHGGGFVPVASQGGVNFWIGNNPLSNGKTAISPAYHGPSTRPGSVYRDSVQVNAQLEAERRLERSLRADEVSSYWFGEALHFVRDQPLAWLALTAKKSYFLLNGYELPSNRELYRIRQWSPVLRALLWDGPPALPFGLLLPLALLGAWLASRAPGIGTTDRGAHRLLLIYLALYGLGTVGFFVTARHRLPLVPVLAIYAALPLTRVPHGLRALRAGRDALRPTRATIGGILTLIAALALSNSNLFDIRSYRQREHHMNLGYAYTQLQRYEEAMAEYRAALREEPQMVRALYNVGTIHMLMGRPSEARAEFAALTELAPGYADAWVQLGRANVELNDFDAAVSAYRRAIAIEPDHARAGYAIALECRRRGDEGCYASFLSRASESDPDDPLINLAMAEMMVERLELERAREFLKRAERISPGSARAQALSRAIDGR